MKDLAHYGALAGRILIAALFLHESWFKITHLDLTIAYMAQYGLPAILLPGALLVELFGGISLIFGVGLRYAEFILALFCASTALIFHMDWTDANQLLHFEKDFALAGALLTVASHEWAATARSLHSSKPGEGAEKGFGCKRAT